MGIASLIYVAFGYLSLLMTILWGMLFFGDSVLFPNMDAAGTAPPHEAALVDLTLVVLLTVLHRLASRGRLRRRREHPLPRALERGTQAWMGAAGLALLYSVWQPLPQMLWIASGPFKWALSALFYIAWTLIVIGAFLATHLDLFESAQGTGLAPAEDGRPAAASLQTLRQPLYGGILIALWATAVMTVGHLLLAGTVTVYVLCDALWAAHQQRAAARATSRAFSLKGERVAS
jgi:hypothetical protein